MNSSEQSKGFKRTCQQALLSRHLCSVYEYLQTVKASRMLHSQYMGNTQGSSTVGFLKIPFNQPALTVTLVNCSSPSCQPLHGKGPPESLRDLKQALNLCFLGDWEELGASPYSMSPVVPLLDTGRVSKQWLGRHVNHTQNNMSCIG